MRDALAFAILLALGTASAVAAVSAPHEGVASAATVGAARYVAYGTPATATPTAQSSGTVGAGRSSAAAGATTDLAYRVVFTDPKGHVDFDATAITTPGRPLPLKVEQDRAYVAGARVSTHPSGASTARIEARKASGAVVSRVRPGVVKTGTSLLLLPGKDNALGVRLDLTRLDAMQTFQEPGTGTAVQLPQTTRIQVAQNVHLAAGHRLVLPVGSHGQDGSIAITRLGRPGATILTRVGRPVGATLTASHGYVQHLSSRAGVERIQTAFETTTRTVK